MSTASLARAAIDAARSDDPASERMLAAMMASAEQQDRATRAIMYTLAGLLAGSLVANVALVAFVLSQSFVLSGFGVSVEAGGQPTVEVRP